MLTNKAIIDQFYQDFYWASKCQVQELDGSLFVSSQYILYLPCNWQDYDKRKFDIIQIAEVANYAPGLIIGGDPNVETVQKISSDETLPETMLFQSKIKQFYLKLVFIDERARNYLSRGAFWQGKCPY